MEKEGNEYKFIKSNAYIQYHIIEYLDSTDHSNLLAHKYFFKLFQKLKIFELYKKINADYSSKLMKNELINHKSAREIMKKYINQYSASKINICFGIIFAKMAKKLNCEIFFNRCRINKKSLHFLSLFVGFSTEVKELTLKLRTQNPKNHSIFSNSFKILFNSINVNQNLTFVKIQMGLAQVSIDKEKKSLTILNIPNSQFVDMIRRMSECFIGIIENVHFNFYSCNYIENSAENLFYLIGHKNSKIKYFVLNFTNVTKSTANSNKIFGKWLEYIIDNMPRLEHVSSFFFINL
jgi:hypothetical protein